MKNRILTGWTFTRVLYLVGGSFICAQSLLDNQWVGIVVGGYFAAMGLFAYGCAAGNCTTVSCSVEPGIKLRQTLKI
jgi:hypothetical protein